MDHRRVVVALVLAGLSACVGGGTDRDAAPPVTGRFEIVVEASDASQSVSLRTGGSFDRAQRRLTIDVDLRAIDPTLGTLHEIAVDGIVYLDCPYLARAVEAKTRWISVRGTADELAALLPFDPLELVHDTVMRFDSGSEGGTAVVSARFFDLGQPITIVAPPPEQVTEVRGG